MNGEPVSTSARFSMDDVIDRNGAIEQFVKVQSIHANRSLAAAKRERGLVGEARFSECPPLARTMRARVRIRTIQAASRVIATASDPATA